MMHKQALAVFLVTVMLGACGGGEAPAGGGDSTAGGAAGSQAGEKTTAMPRSPAPEDARLFFITPADGDTVTNPVRVEFGLEGMEVVKAGTDKPNAGHHHLIIDADLPELSMPIPATDHYRHFGDGSTSTEITLEPGEHTLRLLLGDHMHIPHKPPVVSDEITITVE